MKKHLLTSLFVLGLLLTSCNGGNPTPQQEDPKEEEPQIIEGRKASDLSGDELKLLPKYIVNRLSSYDSYKAVTKGSTVANVLFIETIQSIDAEAIKGKDYSYYRNESHSDIVNTTHVAYFHDNKTAFKNNGESNYQISTLADYSKTYGVYPFGECIEGYSISYFAVLDVKRLDNEEDYKFQISFDPLKATNDVRVQMKAFGGLDDYPTFSDIKMTITVKEDFTPTVLSLESTYTAQKLIQSSCKQSYTVTYSSYNENIEIENLDEAKEVLEPANSK